MAAEPKNNPERLIELTITKETEASKNVWAFSSITEKPTINPKTESIPITNGVKLNSLHSPATNPISMDMIIPIRNAIAAILFSGRLITIIYHI